MPSKAEILIELERRGELEALSPKKSEIVQELKTRAADPKELSSHPILGLIQRWMTPGIQHTALVGGFQAGGTFIGGKLGGPPLAKTGGALGAALGEATYQKMQGEELSPERIAATGGGAALGEGLVTAGKLAKPFMTPTRGAETLNKLAGPEVENFIEKFAPTGKASQLFTQAAQEGGRIPMPKTLQSLDALISKMGKASTPPTYMNYLTNLRDKITNDFGLLDPENLQQEMEIFGKTVGKLEREAGSTFGASKDLFKSMNDDLDNAVNLAKGASTLRLARDTYKRQAAIDTAIELSKTASKTLRGQGDAVQFNPAEVIRKIKEDKFFGQAFTPAEQKEIFGLLHNLNRIPALRPGAGQQAGSFQAMKSLKKAFGFAGGGAAVSGGDPVVTGTMAAIGAAYDPAREMLRNIWIAASMKEGRALLKEIIKDGGISNTGASVLGAFVASQLGENQDWGSLQGKSMLKVGPEGMTIEPGYINKEP